MHVSEERFRELVRRAIDALPPAFRSRLRNVEVIVAPKPTAEQQAAFRGLLLGLYHGVPQPRRSSFMPFVPPDMIFLFQKNIERICRSEEELEREIRATLQHEIGHHFGLSEEQLRDV
ncbi:MAG: metallopeptidase family protein [Acidobacteria bacterium]|nr:metallopeptidase family protein [Acidobacteriota bacterium]